MPALAGRGALTAVAALALAGGGAGAAFAGEAPVDDANQSTTHDTGSHDGDHGHDGKHEHGPKKLHSCSLPVLDPTVKDTTHSVGAGSVHELVCPPVSEVLHTAGL